MKSPFLKKLVPHLIAAGIFLFVAIFYCSPALQGKVVNQHDVLGWKGMAQQSFEYKEKYGRFPLWNISMFSGMPAYSIAMDQDFPLSVNWFYLALTLGMPTPVSYFFIACVAFYFLCQVLKIRPWLSVMAALAFAYSTYDPVIIAVGHNTKMEALAVAPAMVVSFLLILQRKYLWGLALLSIFAGTQIGTQHLQIVYYTILTFGAIGICYFIYALKHAELKHAFISFGLAALGGIIGFLCFAVSMLPVQEYAKETMRGGKSELTDTTSAGNKTKGGLDKDYAFNWSYGIAETSTLMVPGSYGGSDGYKSGSHYNASTKFTEKFSEAGAPEDAALEYENTYSYWGKQPGTSGPVYLGAVICFLFIFGLVYVKSWHKWWIVAISILGILMAWGKNFSAFNYFLFDYLPFYNKFRAPTMSLVLPQLAFPILSALGLEQLLNGAESREYIWKKFRLATIITAGVFVILLLVYLGADFRGRNDNALRDSFAMQMSQGSNNPQAQQQSLTFAQSLIKALQEDRASLFRADLVRSSVLVLIAVLLMAAYIKDKIKPTLLIVGLLLLSSFDLLTIGRRYLNNDKFVEKDEFETSFTPTAADRQIMADPNKPFRVFDQTEEWYQSSRASYFHNSVGGYHAAKLGLYNDLIEHQIGKGNMEVLNMLNTKYFIMQDPSSRQAVARINPGAFGPVWLVKGIKYVKNSDEEMQALDSTHLRDTAAVQEKFKSSIKFPPQFDTAASIRVTEYLNDNVKYELNASTNQFVVFSEVYYPRGWNAYLDGNKAEYVKTDYVLRGMSVPAGKHQIEFKFEPRSYALGNTISMIATFLAYGLLAAAIFLEVRKKKTTA